MRFRRRITLVMSAVLMALLPSWPSRADMFGGDTMVLTQMLANAIKQLYELQEIVRAGQDSLNLMKDINRGINDSLRMVSSSGHSTDPGLYREVLRAEDLLRHLSDGYGAVSDSPNKTSQSETDQVVSEGVALNNALYDYAKELDQVGEQIKEYSHEVSPGGAQKLTAQSLGVMVHIMNQQLRATATGLKISAQALALQNKREKSDTAGFLNEANVLQDAMQKKETNFTFPRF